MTDRDLDLSEQLAIGLIVSPQAAASALKAIVEMSRQQAAAGHYAPIRPSADRADAAVELVRAKTGLADESLSKLATLAQQVCAVLAYVGDSDGIRDSGYYRAALAHAERIDAMTENTLQLVKLVELIGD